MNTAQKIVLCIVVVAVLGMLLCPPFHLIRADGIVINLGYGYVFDPPPTPSGKYRGSVNTTLLLLQWFGVLIAGGITFIISGTGKKKIHTKDNSKNDERFLGATVKEKTIITTLSCPHCGYSQGVVANKIPRNATDANCPACRQKFLFQNPHNIVNNSHSINKIDDCEEMLSILPEKTQHKKQNRFLYSLKMASLLSVTYTLSIVMVRFVYFANNYDDKTYMKIIAGIFSFPLLLLGFYVYAVLFKTNDRITTSKDTHSLPAVKNVEQQVSSNTCETCSHLLSSFSSSEKYCRILSRDVDLNYTCHNYK